MFFRSKVVVTLRGGLGNNLFQYFAGLFLAEKLGVQLVVFAPRPGYSDPKNSTIHGFKVQGTITAPKKTASLHLALLLALNKLWQKVLEGKAGPLPKIFSRCGIHFSPNHGFDPDLEKMNPPFRLEGYFASHRYFTSSVLTPNLRELTQESSQNSAWFRSSVPIMKNHKALSIHIRRGDYLDHKHSNGLLAERYYIDAIGRLRTLGAKWDSLWVFTDDEASVRQEFKHLFTTEKAKFFEGASLANPGEVLAVMSESTYLITANSTFSWWAAMLGNQSKLVVAPAKWAKGMQDPEDLIPNSWIRQESKWLD